MPEFHSEAPAPAAAASTAEAGETLFPPVTRDHILYCSYDYWFPKYRKVCIKSRIIELSPDAVEYLREDGIVLSDDSNGNGEDDDDDDWEPSNPTMKHYPSADETKYESFQEDDDSEDDEDENAPATVRLPPNKRFPEIHRQIQEAIAALGGTAAPKLNWSSPKDATWLMAEKNTMQCHTPDDVYLLLKSSNFVTHDLEHAFDGCLPATAATSVTPAAAATALGFSPVLVLRSYFNMHTALEFRCFVKHRNLVAITPRDLKYYPYLAGLRSAIVARAKTLFHSKLQFTFPSGSFSFDIYIPEKQGYDDSDVGDNDDQADARLSWARLIDINPWAPRTDTLLFSWRELLDLKIPKPFLGIVGDSGVADVEGDEEEGDDDDEDDDDDDDSDEQDYEPELRLVEQDDPAAMNFSSSPYSAHKLPKEVVDASMAGEGGLRKFAQEWQQMVERREGTGDRR